MMSRKEDADAWRFKGMSGAHAVLTGRSSTAPGGPPPPAEDVPLPGDEFAPPPPL